MIEGIDVSSTASTVSAASISLRLTSQLLHEFDRITWPRVKFTPLVVAVLRPAIFVLYLPLRRRVNTIRVSAGTHRRRLRCNVIGSNRQLHRRYQTATDGWICLADSAWLPAYGQLHVDTCQVDQADPFDSLRTRTVRRTMRV